MNSEAKAQDRPLFLLGATGVGKSAVALQWARAFSARNGVAILTMDAMQVYRGANIGTSKPPPAERAEFPHGGLDLVDFEGSFDVARYLNHAAVFLREQKEAGRPVLVVGGTGLYFRALTRGLCEAPRGSEELRGELRTLPLEELRARLARVDPDMMARIDLNNPRRLSRAIEVMETTGRSLAAWQAETTEARVPALNAVWFQREKAEMKMLIAERIEAMFSAGWVDEVRGLLTLYGAEKVRAFPAIGYRQLADLLAGGITVENAKRDISMATRQYAKRQLTWFAREPNLTRLMLSGSQPPSVPAHFSV